MIGLAFVVVRGPALAGKTTIARRLAERLPGKAALISQDDLATRWIVRHDDDVPAETELVYRQIRLLAASYLRGGYHIVVDGAFALEREGVAALHESDLRELLALVATIQHVRPLLVAVTAPLRVLRERARESERWDERAAEAMYRAFEAGASRSPVTLDTSRLAPDEAVDRILAQLGARG